MGPRGQSWRPDRPAQNGMELLEFSPRNSEPPVLQARPQDLFGPRRARHTEEQAACRRQLDGEIATPDPTQKSDGRLNDLVSGDLNSDGLLLHVDHIGRTDHVADATAGAFFELDAFDHAVS